MATAAVFLGGPHPRHAVDATRAGDGPDLVVAADSGLHLALESGYQVDLVIGDMDSVEPDRLRQAEQAGAEVLRHRVDKDVTDLELALEVAVARGADEIVVIGSDGGRMDHLLGGALTLAAPRFADVSIDAWFGGARLLPIHARRHLEGRLGGIVSLVPAGGAASGVRTDGLRWPLRGARLVAGTSWGISNEFVAPVAHITVDDGCVVAIIPEEELPT